VFIRTLVRDTSESNSGGRAIEKTATGQYL
jgi:hypothetical protein